MKGHALNTVNCRAAEIGHKMQSKIVSFIVKVLKKGLKPSMVVVQKKIVAVDRDC